MESILLENDPKVEEITGVQVDDALLMPTKQGFAQLLVSNRSGFTQSIEEGVILGEAVEATVISPGDVPSEECGSEASAAGVRDTLEECTDSELVRRVMSVEEEQARRKKLLEQLEEPHLPESEKNGVIQPSKSPWASPVVLVPKRDGLHQFCVDYRGLNAVTKADSFPLPRIEDLLHQLGNSKYFLNP